MVHTVMDEERVPLLRSGEYQRQNSIIGKDDNIKHQGNGVVHNSNINGQLNKSSKETNSHLLGKEHCHDNEDDKIDTMARKRLIFVSCLCLAFMVGEAVGGIIANSLAVATDAAHLLTDFVGFMISLMALYVSAKPATKRMSFGWHRAEVLGALISVLLIWAVTAVLVYMAVQRVRTGHYEVNGSIMLITASIGVTINLIMGFTLQCGCAPSDKSNSGGEKGLKGSTENSGSNTGVQNINVRAAFIHVIGDLIQSVGVLIAAFIIYFKPEYSIVDPICTFFFSLLVLITTITILKDVINVLMEGMPNGMDFKDIMKLLYAIPGVVKVHNLRIWSLSMDKTALSAHIAIDNKKNSMVILGKASECLRANYDIYELTLQVEEYKSVMDDCRKCKIPE